MTTTPQNPVRNRPPGWLNGLIVLAVLVLGLYAVYYFVFKSDERPPKVIESNSAANPNNPLNALAGRNRGARAANPGRTQSQQPLINILSGSGAPASNNPISYTYDDQKGVGKIKIRYENSIVNADYEGPARGGSRNPASAAPTRNSGIVNLTFDYNIDLKMSWVSVDEMNLHTLAWRAATTPSAAETAGVTNDQRRQLDALSYLPKLTNPEDTQLKKLLLNWVITPDDPSKNEVLNYIKSISKLHLDETKASFKKRIESIPNILTPDQITKLKNN